MQSRGVWLIGALLVAGVTAGVAVPLAWRWWTASPRGYCPVCRRHEHKESLVKFQAEGERVTEVCCLSCALTYGRQTSKAVTILSVTDHDSGKPLDPDGVTFVVGSNVSPCTHDAEQLRMEGETVPVHWDRCMPSILAFASQEAAGGFQRRHGGALRGLEELKQQAAEKEALH
ncbi:MAG: hypothetical protein HY699_19930 [Deltaproteobacteria bacterium]|nr:hypothetical protein [Deltaproteobacteria bacterium]